MLAGHSGGLLPASVFSGGPATAKECKASGLKKPQHASFKMSTTNAVRKYRDSETKDRGVKTRVKRAKRGKVTHVQAEKALSIALNAL